jgi:hypothetical protein
MPGAEIPQGLAAAASNPATDQETLRQIAFHYPQLRAAVAANPSAYQGLLDWLRALGDASVNEALADRARFESAPDRTIVLAPQTGPATGSAGPAPVFPPVAAAGETPAQGLRQADGEPPARKNSTGMKAALALLLVVALALAGIVIAIFSGAFGDDGAAQSQPSASPQPSTTAPSTASPSSPTPSASTAEPEKYPAPDGAVLAQSFTAPSGNILCDLGEDVVTCSILEQSYATAGFESCGATTTTITATGESAGLSCGSAVSGGGSPLAYGSSATNGHSACVSTQDGVSCWNTASGRSFALARGGWQTGTEGQISPDDFRW